MSRSVSIALACLLLSACHGHAGDNAPVTTASAHPKTLDDFHDSDWRGLSDSYTHRVRTAADAGELLQRYELAKKYGTPGDVCVASMGLTNGYAEAGDEVSWRQADRQSRKDCLPDSRTWEKKSAPEFPKYDDAAIARDPALASQAAEFREYVRVASESAREWREHDARFYAESYEHDLNGGTFDERCTDAFHAAAQYLEALDESSYAKWKAIQETDCKAAGDTIATRAAASGAY
jgi:hypothetical protein